MIYNLFFYTLGLLTNAFTALFSVIDYVFPPEFQQSVVFFVNHLAYAKGIFPVNALLNAISLYLSFIALFYGLKVVLWVFAHTPWIGSHKKMPSLSHKPGKGH